LSAPRARLVLISLALGVAACGGGGGGGDQAPAKEPESSEASAGDERDHEATASSAAPSRDPAEALFFAGRYDDAIALLATREPDETTVRAMARAHLRRGRITNALELLRGLDERAPSLAVAVDIGEALLLEGGVHEARAYLMRPIDAYNDDEIAASDAAGLLAVARAARALGSPKDANEAFRAASRASPGDADVELAWGRLFLEAHAPEEAARSVQAALDARPDDPDVHALLAEVRFELGAPPGLAVEAAKKALALNPSHVGARVFLAGLALRHHDAATATSELDLAEAVNPKDLDVLATRAAIAWIFDRHEEFRALERRVRELHPGYGALYERVASFAEYGHRYAEGVELAERALSIAPRDARALARRGLNLLRLAREDEGRRDLEAAFRRDPFDVRVYNTLELYDRTIDREYEVFESAPFTFRMHRSERPILERVVPELLHEARRAMSKRYGFEPRRPIQIELYAEADDFAVRTSGLPGLGLQGVCFGHVITAVSPKAGPFNWGQILWHELAHVYHLQLSRSRVPRWFTEGLAEHESEISPHAFVREMDHDVVVMLREGRIPSFHDFDSVFFSARSMEELVGAYALSAEAGAFLDERFGARALREVLVGFGEGRSFPELVARVLRMEVPALDAAFRDHLRAKLARFEGQFVSASFALPSVEEAERAAREAPRDARALARYAEVLLRRGRGREAREAAERSLSIDETPEARFVLARLALAKEPGVARGHLERLIEKMDGVDPRLMLASVALREGHLEEARRLLEGATRLDPRRREPWDGLREIAKRSKDPQAEREALEHITELEIHAREPHVALLRATADAGDYASLAERATRAVFVAPHEALVHEARLLAWSSLGKPKEALEALEDLRRVSKEPRAEPLERAAQALERAGHRRAARDVRRTISTPSAARP
jgi:cellulose synthase operon protein C